MQQEAETEEFQPRMDTDGHGFYRSEEERFQTSVAEGEILSDPVNVSGPEDGCVSQGAAAFGILGLEQMAPARAAEQDFASGGNLETFGYGFSGLIASRTSHIYSLALLGAGAVPHPGWVNRQIRAIQRSLRMGRSASAAAGSATGGGGITGSG